MAKASQPETTGTGLRAGVARRCITPATPGYIAGDVLDDEPAVIDVHQDLYAQTLCLDCGTSRLAFITVDVCKVSRDMLHRVRRGLAERLGLGPAEIMIAASHTHSAPHTIESDAVPGQFDDSFARQAADGMVESAVAASERLRPACLRYATGRSDLGVSKRLVTPWGVLMRANPAGAYDPEVGVLVVESHDAGPVAVVCTYASHPIGHLRSELSSDLSGVLRGWLEDAYPGCMGFHALGCAGDVSPRSRWDGTGYEIGNPHTGAGRRTSSEMENKRQMEAAGKALAEIAGGVVSSGAGERFTGPITATLETLELPLQPPPDCEQLEAALSLPLNHKHRGWAELMLARLRAGGSLPRSNPYPIQVWRAGDAFCLVGLGGEPLCELGMLIKRRLAPLPCLTLGHVNEYKGYIPTRRATLEGGYDGPESFYNTLLPAPHAPEIEDLIIDGAVALADTIREVQR